MVLTAVYKAPKWMGNKKFEKPKKKDKKKGDPTLVGQLCAMFLIVIMIMILAN